eukprot:UN15821
MFVYTALGGKQTKVKANSASLLSQSISKLQPLLRSKCGGEITKFFGLRVEDVNKNTITSEFSYHGKVSLVLPGSEGTKEENVIEYMTKPGLESLYYIIQESLVNSIDELIQLTDIRLIDIGVDKKIIPKYR